jgi:hypothetical protein
MQVTMMMLRSQLIEKALDHLQPKAIIYTTGTTYPPARMMSRLAHKQGIPFIVMACRPMFTPLRPEERLTRVDLDPKANAFVADDFLVLDEFSKETLIRSGYPAEDIFLHNPIRTERNYTAQRETVANGLLVLFTNDEELNDKLLRSVLLLQPEMTGHLFIREHSSIPLAQTQREKLSKAFPDHIDISNKSLYDISFSDVIALTVNTTAMVETSRHGCGAVWLRYHNQRSVVYYPVMELLGQVVNSDRDLLAVQESLLNNPAARKAHIAACKAAYANFFDGTDSTASLYEKHGLL